MDWDLERRMKTSTYPSLPHLTTAALQKQLLAANVGLGLPARLMISNDCSKKPSRLSRLGNVPSWRHSWKGLKANLEAAKLHSLGDEMEWIRRLGISRQIMQRSKDSAAMSVVFCLIYRRSTNGGTLESRLRSSVSFHAPLPAMPPLRLISILDSRCEP